MANSKEIKVQIASIGNTQKITSAMEKVAVSKMKKTQDKMLKGRPYRDRMLGVISHLAKGQPEYKPKTKRQSVVAAWVAKSRCPRRSPPRTKNLKFVRQVGGCNS